MKSPRVAIVADWIIGGGAERVVEELHNLYPEAPIYASYCTPEWRTRLDNKVVTGYLQNKPFSTLRKLVGVLRIHWYRNLDLKDYDVVISCTGNGEAKHIRTSGSTKHISYCFTPVHYYWRHYQTYIENPGLGPFNWLARFGLRLLVSPLRRKDYQAAQHVDQFVAISEHIQSDIQEYYDQKSVVIAPPVNTERFTQAGQSSNKRSGFVTMGRQTAVKRTDIVVDACTKLELPLRVIGRGPQHEDLVQRAGPTVEFLTDVTDEQMPELLAAADAFLFASFEDFGIAPVEAMAAGTPVIAYRSGGALDYVTKDTGLFFDEQTPASLQEAITGFDAKEFNPKTIQKQGTNFSVQEFKEKISTLVQKTN